MALRQVFKYYLPTHGSIVMPMPRGWGFCAVRQQADRLVLWAEVDPSAPRESQQFFVYMTGEEIDPKAYYLGTVLFNEGSYVVHVYTKETQ
jgi:hypothetical protein